MSATLAVLAHGAAGGGAPAAGAALLLLGLSAVLACAATSVPWLSSSRIGLWGLLCAGQLLAHLVLAVTGHHHHMASTGMVLAHGAAIFGCAVLIALAERVGQRCAAALFRVLPRLLVAVPPPAPALFVLAAMGVPTQRSAVIAASIGRRGPPLR